MLTAKNTVLPGHSLLFPMLSILVEKNGFLSRFTFLRHVQNFGLSVVPHRERTNLSPSCMFQGMIWLSVSASFFSLNMLLHSPLSFCSVAYDIRAAEKFTLWSAFAYGISIISYKRLQSTLFSLSVCTTCHTCPIHEESSYMFLPLFSPLL